MATLAEIQAAMEAGNQVIDSQNPYARLADTSDAITQLFTKNASKDNFKQAAIGAAISGLIGGGLSGLSTNYKAKKQGEYQDTLKNLLAGKTDYQNPNISSALFGQAKNVADLFKITQDSRDYEDKRNFKNLLAAQAAQAVGQINQAKISQAKELQKEQIENYKNVLEAGKQGKKLKQLASGLEKSLQNAGNTGFGGRIGQFVSGLAGTVSDKQAQKYAAGQEVDSYEAEIVNLAREAGSGPMTDQDAQRYLRSGAGLDKEESVNQDIINRLHYVADLQNQYEQHMSKARKENKPVYEAEQEWSNLVSENPYFIKDPKTNKVLENPNWKTGLGIATAPTQASTMTKIGRDGKLYKVRDLGNGQFEVVE